MACLDGDGRFRRGDGEWWWAEVEVEELKDGSDFLFKVVV